MKKIAATLLMLLYFCQSLVGCFEVTQVSYNTSDFDTDYEEACTTPFGKYPETITYTLGKISGVNVETNADEIKFTIKQVEH